MTSRRIRSGVHTRISIPTWASRRCATAWDRRRRLRADMPHHTRKPSVSSSTTIIFSSLQAAHRSFIRWRFRNTTRTATTFTSALRRSRAWTTRSTADIATTFRITGAALTRQTPKEALRRRFIRRSWGSTTRTEASRTMKTRPHTTVTVIP